VFSSPLMPSRVRQEDLTFEEGDFGTHVVLFSSPIYEILFLSRPTQTSEAGTHSDWLGDSACRPDVRH